MFDFKDRTCIITGAGNGIGRVLALAFARHGANVLVSDIDTMGGETVVKEIHSGGGRAFFSEVDVSREPDTIKMAKTAKEKFGGIDILVNNAGLLMVEPKPFSEITQKDWDRMMAVNVGGPFLCTKAVFPYMKRSGHGKIVNVASNAVFSGGSGRLQYVTSKSSVVGLTRALARELGDHGICVNAIAPGLTRSGRFKPSEDSFSMRIAQRAIKRDEMPEDLVGSVLFLSSPWSDFITGQTLVVDGGQVLH